MVVWGTKSGAQDREMKWPVTRKVASRQGISLISAVPLAFLSNSVPNDFPGSVCAYKEFKCQTKITMKPMCQEPATRGAEGSIRTPFTTRQ